MIPLLMNKMALEFDDRVKIIHFPYYLSSEIQLQTKTTFSAFSDMNTAFDRINSFFYIINCF